jgi:hypothetical protein
MVHHRYQQHQQQNCRWYQRHQRQLATGINNTGGKFATGINDTGGKQWEQLSDCWQLKMNLKQKNLSICKLNYPKVFKRNNENFSDLSFFLFSTGGAS